MNVNSKSIRELPEKGDLALIAIIDSGADIYHQSFLDTAGSTRIIAIWDQNIPGDNGFGIKYGKDEINQKINQEQSVNKPPDDRLMHGTRVTSIAASSEVTFNDQTLIGVASESEIILVIPKREGQSREETYLQGRGIKAGYPEIFEYIQELSKEYRRPVVVNISQGYNLGPHDGTSTFERKCDDFSDEGLFFVTSAGNEQDKKSHARLNIPVGEYSFIKWQSKVCMRKRDTIEIRFNSHNIMKFRLHRPNIEDLQEDVSEWVYIHEQKEHHFLTGDSAILSYRAYEEDNGDATLTINIYNKNSDLIEVGIWKIEVEGIEIHNKDDVIDAWIENSGISRERPIEFVDNVSKNINLTMPGTAAKVIAVGSVISSSNPTVEVYSSFGPTRDDRNQPFISSVGGNIVAAMPDRVRIRPSTLSLISNGATSYAAPFVTGAIALLLSAREKRRMEDSNVKQLTSDDIKRFIVNVADSQSITWNCATGYGLLDLQALLEEEAKDASYIS
jgi:subtilisin family serine protease